MKNFALVVLLAACAGKQQTPPTTGSGSDQGVVKDTRSEIEKRRDAACEALKPRLVQCAVDDAKQDLAEGKVTKAQFDKDTSPEVQHGLGEDWLRKCQVDMSSRQVRVLEVCFKEEPQCGPLVSCLDHLNDKSK